MNRQPTDEEARLLRDIEQLSADCERAVRDVLDTRAIGADVRPVPEGQPPSEDKRWASVARTHFQQGLMALRRSVLLPEEF